MDTHAMKDMEGATFGQVRHSDGVDKIINALVEARKSMPTITKSGHNDFANYDYLRFDDLVAPVTDVLTKNDIFPITSVRSIHPMAPRQGKSSTQYGVMVELTMKMIHKSGQWIEILGAGEATDTQDKSIYKAITGARKYLLSMAMSLGGGDDPENETGADQVTPRPVERPYKGPAKPRLVKPEQPVHSPLLSGDDDPDWLDQKMFGKKFAHCTWGMMIEPEGPDEEPGSRLSYLNWISKGDPKRFKALSPEVKAKADFMLARYEKGVAADAKDKGYTPDPDSAPDDPNWNQPPPHSDDDVF